MLVTLAVLFFLTWGPRSIFDLLVETSSILFDAGQDKSDERRFRQNLRFISQLNSCLNPIVYAITSR